VQLTIKRYLALLATYLEPQKYKVVWLTLLLLIGIGLQLLNPFLLKYFIDTAIAQGPSLLLVGVGILFILVALTNQGIAVLTAYLSGFVAWTATNQLRTDLVTHCLALDLPFHKARTVGELIERIDGDVDALSNFFSQLVISLFTNGLLLLGILIIFFVLDWRAGLVMSLFSIFAVTVLFYMRRRGIPYWKGQRQASADFFGFLGERLVGTIDLRANGATHYVMRRFYLLLQRIFLINRKATVSSIYMGDISLFLFVCGNMLAICIGAYLWSLHIVTVGTIYLMFAITDKLSQPLRQIQIQLQDLQQAEACVQRVEELLHIKPVLLDTGICTLAAGALEIMFDNVSFGYTPEHKVIKELSFHMEPGHVLGLLGRTGSGKTTLSRLLFRLYDVQAGSILLNGIPNQQIRLSDLRRSIGLVTQDIQLFHASVRDNLTFFNPTINDSQIIAALTEIGLAAWYQSLPQGLDTELGPDGAGLSAGESQLLAFTRVFLDDPGLIILDEASSRLDPATEHLIEKAIDTLFAGRTAIVIAHRLSTMRRADEILLLEDGKLAEYGNRAELAQKPTSRFAQLLRTGLEEVLS
jgi:ATP-binding cassette subfamily B protein